MDIYLCLVYLIAIDNIFMWLCNNSLIFSGGLASADWSVRRSDPHTVLAIPIPAIESTTVPTAASLPHEGLGNPLGRSKRKVVENRDLCRIISSYVPEVNLA